MQQAGGKAVPFMAFFDPQGEPIAPYRGPHRVKDFERARADCEEAASRFERLGARGFLGDALNALADDSRVRRNALFRHAAEVAIDAPLPGGLSIGPVHQFPSCAI